MTEHWYLPPWKPDKALRLCLRAAVYWWVFVLTVTGALAEVTFDSNVESRDLTELAWKVFETTWGDPWIRYPVAGALALGWILRSWKRRRTE